MTRPFPRTWRAAGAFAIVAATALAAVPALAQRPGRMTFVMAQGNAVQQLQFLDGQDLAVRVRQMLTQGAVSGISTPLLLDGHDHEERFRQGGDPAVLGGRNFSRTVVRGFHRDIVLAYGPSKNGGIGVYTSVDDSTLVPDVNGNVVETPGEHSEITGTVPNNGQPYAIARQIPAPAGITLLPKTLIVLVEP
jgi:hypothetical protein